MFSSNPLRTLYLQPQAALATVVATGNVWNSATAKFVPFEKANLVCDFDLIQADYKTGNASTMAGIQGRASKCTADFTLPVMPSGAAGTPPAIDALLQNIFGVAPTIAASTSVTYNQADGPGVPLTAALFNKASNNASQQLAYGIVLATATMNFGGEGDLSIDANGPAYYCLDSDNWANEDTAAKGGLTSSPTTEPTPTLLGNIIPSFLSTSISVGGNSLVELVSGQISIQPGRSIRFDGGKYGTGVVQGRRAVGVKSLKFADSDSGSVTALKVLAKSKAAGDIVIVLGGQAGYTITVTLKSAQLSGATYSENSNGGLDVEFSDNMAHQSGLTSKNEITAAFT